MGMSLGEQLDVMNKRREYERPARPVNKACGSAQYPDPETEHSTSGVIIQPGQGSTRLFDPREYNLLNGYASFSL